jgi:glycosyltransferase involved in cell wall biosynthesis
VETPPLPPVRPDGSLWPRISIVTPSYNQGQFIEETIRSVLLQGYPNLEYIIMDGGSTDGTVDIIRKYEPWFTYWESKKDRGQAHAINKGLERATGTIGCYLNSDDYYLQGAFHYAADSFAQHLWDLLIGRQDPSNYSPRWRWLRYRWWRRKFVLLPPAPFLIGGEVYEVAQESTFWNHAKFNALRFDESLHSCLDVDWYCRISSGAHILLTSREIGYFRLQPLQKTANLQHVAYNEIRRISERENVCLNWAAYREINHSYFTKRLTLLIRRMLSGVAEFTYTHPHKLNNSDDGDAHCITHNQN